MVKIHNDVGGQSEKHSDGTLTYTATKRDVAAQAVAA